LTALATFDFDFALLMEGVDRKACVAKAAWEDRQFHDLRKVALVHPAGGFASTAGHGFREVRPAVCPPLDDLIGER
jgi:hypothetical protein